MDERTIQENEAERNAPVNFELGRILLTPDAVKAFDESGASLYTYLDRHYAGDWGHVSKRDKKKNRLAVKKGCQVFSAYKLPNTGMKIWVITEADRSATIIDLTSEYYKNSWYAQYAYPHYNS